MPPQLIERKSGLLVPRGIVVKPERAMARKKFQRLLRDMAFSRDCGLITRYLCTRCRQPVKLSHGAQGLIQTDARENAINPATDNFTLECSCSVWKVKA